MVWICDKYSKKSFFILLYKLYNLYLCFIINDCVLFIFVLRYSIQILLIIPLLDPLVYLIFILLYANFPYL